MTTDLNAPAPVAERIARRLRQGYGAEASPAARAVAILRGAVVIEIIDALTGDRVPEHVLRRRDPRFVLDPGGPGNYGHDLTLFKP